MINRTLEMASLEEMTDTALRKIQNFIGLDKKPDYEKKKTPSQWQPYAGFVYFHFLLDKLRTKGRLP